MLLFIVGLLIGSLVRVDLGLFVRLVLVDFTVVYVGLLACFVIVGCECLYLVFRL